MTNFMNIPEMESLSQHELHTVDGGMIFVAKWGMSLTKTTINFVAGVGEGLRDGWEIAKQNWN